MVVLTPEQSEFIKKSAPLRDKLISKYFDAFGDKNKYVFMEREVLLFMLAGFVHCILNSQPDLTVEKMKQNGIDFLEHYEVIIGMMEEYYKARV